MSALREEKAIEPAAASPASNEAEALQEALLQMPLEDEAKIDVFESWQRLRAAQRNRHEALLAMGKEVDYIANKYNGIYLRIITDIFGMSYDSANNYRNYFLHCHDWPAEALDRIDEGAAYKLARGNVDESVRNLALDLALTTQTNVTAAIASQAKNVMRHGSTTLKSKMLSLQISVPDANRLVQALSECTQYIRNLCTRFSIENADIVYGLDRLYRDWLGTSDLYRPEKTWAEIEDNEYHLVWYKGNREFDVHIRDASKYDLEAYIDYRRWTHLEKKKLEEEELRGEELVEATVQLSFFDILEDGSARVQGLNALPFDLSQYAGQDIEVTIIVKRKKKEGEDGSNTV